MRRSMTNSHPSCSSAEALHRQHPFINQTLAQHGLALLSRLFSREPIAYHGGFLNLASGSVVPLRADPVVWKRIHKRARRPLQSDLSVNGRVPAGTAAILHHHAQGGEPAHMLQTAGRPDRQRGWRT